MSLVAVKFRWRNHAICLFETQITLVSLFSAMCLFCNLECMRSSFEICNGTAMALPQLVTARRVIKNAGNNLQNTPVSKHVHEFIRYFTLFKMRNLLQWVLKFHISTINRFQFSLIEICKFCIIFMKYGRVTEAICYIPERIFWI